MQNTADLQAVLIAAIQERKLRQTIETLDQDSGSIPADLRDHLAEIQGAISQLDLDVENEIARVREACTDNGVASVAVTRAMPEALTHGITLTVARADVSKVAALVEQLGYESPTREKPEWWSRLLHFFDSVTFWSTTGTQYHLTLQWDPAFRLPGRIGQVLTPTLEDLDAVSLPSKAWPGYYLVRVLRRGFGGKQSSPDSLGPFLGTPSGLIEPLLEFAGFQDGQQLIDLGCGDGRVLLTAAESFSADAIGYETEPHLLRDARAKVAAVGLEESIKIVDGDARDADVSQADVVFIFLPIDAIASLLPSLLDRMKPGAVVIAHEQEKLDVAPAPMEKVPIIHAGGVTIAHKWQVEAAETTS